jgi:hypothetical protein
LETQTATQELAIANLLSGSLKKTRDLHQGLIPKVNH